MKKLTLAIVAVLAVGASAQTRHYSTGHGMVTVTPSGAYETSVVQVVPVDTLRVSPTSGRIIFVVPPSQARALNVRYYDTADTSDDLYLLEDRDSDAVHQTREVRVIRDVDNR